MVSKIPFFKFYYNFSLFSTYGNFFLPENFIYELDMRPIPAGYEDSLPMKLTENEILVTGMEPETLYYFMIKARSSDNVLTTDEFVISQATG